MSIFLAAWGAWWSPTWFREREPLISRILNHSPASFGSWRCQQLPQSTVFLLLPRNSTIEARQGLGSLRDENIAWVTVPRLDEIVDKDLLRDPWVSFGVSKWTLPPRKRPQDLIWEFGGTIRKRHGDSKRVLPFSLIAHSAPVHYVRELSGSLLKFSGGQDPGNAGSLIPLIAETAATTRGECQQVMDY